MLIPSGWGDSVAQEVYQPHWDLSAGIKHHHHFTHTYILLYIFVLYKNKRKSYKPTNQPKWLFSDPAVRPLMSMRSRPPSWSSCSKKPPSATPGNWLECVLNPTPKPICDSSKALAKVQDSVLLINCNIESQRALLRQVHSRPQLDAVLERRGMSLDMHGKVHLVVEHC